MSQQPEAVEVRSNCYNTVVTSRPAHNALAKLGVENRVSADYATIAVEDGCTLRPLVDYKRFLSQLSTEVIDPMQLVLEAAKLGRQRFVDEMETLLNALQLIRNNAAIPDNVTASLNWELSETIGDVVKLCHQCLVDEDGRFNESALRIFGQFDFHIEQADIGRDYGQPFVAGNPRGVIYTQKGKLVF